MPAEKRVDPEDGAAYTYDELAAFYKGKYKKTVIDAYWESCSPAKASKGKGKGKGAEPKSKAKAKAKVKAKAKEAGAKEKAEKKPRDLTIGYHMIRGLGAPLRMMCYYQSQAFKNVAYGNDVAEKWFGDEKNTLKEKNSCVNLPYIKLGDQVITQSNTCLLFLGRVLRIDKPKDSMDNHCVLDQVMDWRNDLMTIVYPFAGKVKEKKDFAEAAKKHLEGTTKTNITKLEGFCKGPYMCGAAPQSADFHVFEMIDQHKDIAAKVGAPDPIEEAPKLKALYEAFKTNAKMTKYFDSQFYKDYFQNNGLYTHFSGVPDDAVYGPTKVTEVSFK